MRLIITNMARSRCCSSNLKQVRPSRYQKALLRPHADQEFKDLPMEPLTLSRRLRKHKRVKHSGKIPSLALTHRHSGGTTTALPFREALLHQKRFSGRDQARWDKAIQRNHPSGETTIYQSLMALSSNPLVIAGSSQPHQPLLRTPNAYTGLLIIENTIRMAPSDFISGSKMAGTVSTLTTDYRAESMVMDSDHGPHRDPMPKPGGCHCLRKLTQSLTKITIELLVAGAKRA